MPLKLQEFWRIRGAEIKHLEILSVTHERTKTEQNRRWVKTDKTVCIFYTIDFLFACFIFYFCECVICICVCMYVCICLCIHLCICAWRTRWFVVRNRSGSLHPPHGGKPLSQTQSRPLWLVLLASHALLTFAWVLGFRTLLLCLNSKFLVYWATFWSPIVQGLFVCLLR